MFGMSRKKKATKQLLSFAHDEEEDDEDAPSSSPSPKQEKKRKRKDKKKSAPMLSFDPDVDGAEEKTDKRKRKKKNKKGGMGYGGMSVPLPDDEMDFVDEQNDSHVYDSAALEKLKREQKIRKDNVSEDKQVFPQTTSSSTHEQKDESDKEEEYISLSGAKTSDPVVLAGDEAMAYVEDDEPIEFDHGLEQQPKSSTSQTTAIDTNSQPQDDEIEQDNRQWEDNMARRAGVLPPSDTKTQKQAHISPSFTTSSLSQIKSSLQPTISNLQNISLDLETSLNRHTSTLESTREEFTKHSSAIETVGAALEYYQILRTELADWVGALRQISSMVDLVYDAQCRWEKNVSFTKFQRGYEWNMDVRDVLRKMGLVNRVVGCCEDDWMEEDEKDAGVDEFGRDLSAMAVMARSKRWEARRRNFLRMKTGGDGAGAQDLTLQEMMNCLSSDNISSDEVADWKSRLQALKEALAIIPSVVNDDYLSVSNLCNLFFRWQDKYPEDYKSCYAEITLVNMISVLARLELCQRWDGLRLCGCFSNEQKDASQSTCNVAQYRWFKEMTLAAKNRSNDANDSSKLIADVLEKSISSHLLRYLTIDPTPDEANNVKNQKDCGLYDPASVSETQWLCSFIGSLQSCISTCAPSNADIPNSTGSKLASSLLSLLKYHVDKKPTMIINADNIIISENGFVHKDEIEFDAETSNAVAYAIFNQANEISLMAVNILSHWLPIVNDSSVNEDVTSLIQFVLMELISLRILPVMHTFQTINSTCNGSEKQTYRDMYQRLLGNIYEAVRCAGLFEKEKWTLCTAPLRAAAQINGLEL